MLGLRRCIQLLLDEAVENVTLMTDLLEVIFSPSSFLFISKHITSSLLRLDGVESGTSTWFGYDNHIEPQQYLVDTRTRNKTTLQDRQVCKTSVDHCWNLDSRRLAIGYRTSHRANQRPAHGLLQHTVLGKFASSVDCTGMAPGSIHQSEREV